MVSIINFIAHNLAHVAPILICGMFAVLIVLERMKTLLWSYAFPQVDAFFAKIRYLVMADKIDEAMSLCEYFEDKPTAQVVKQALVRAHQPESLIEHGLQVMVSEVSEKIQLRTGFLATIANVATLLGLLGTILGLIQSFEAVGSANAQQRAALLAAGISTAMNATMLGLSVAIPCMIAYSFLMNRSNRLIAEMERSAVRILELLKERFYATELEAELDVSSRSDRRERIQIV